VPTLFDIPKSLMVGLALALGLAFGSFLNVVIYRLPRGESLVRPGSRCPGCGKPIAGYDNVPLLSWLVLRGRARCCGVKISPRYPLIELIGGLLALAILELLVMDLPGTTSLGRALGLFALYLGLGLMLIAAAFIDLEHMYLPDALTIGGALLGIASVPLRPEISWLEALAGAALGFVMIWLPFDVIYRKLRGHAGMGLGDAKLVMLAGAWFGYQGAVFALLAGAVQATLLAFSVLAARGKIDEPEAVVRERAELDRAIAAAEGEERALLEREKALDPIGHAPESGLGKARLAFGPFLALATLEYMLFHDNLLIGLFDALGVS
jgi:leader peptidase (prepilin peptidase) / N-methyltransferase